MQQMQQVKEVQQKSDTRSSASGVLAGRLAWMFLEAFDIQGSRDDKRPWSLIYAFARLVAPVSTQVDRLFARGVR
jgi:hypothetical protein